jgi:hypothetical protein
LAVSAGRALSSASPDRHFQQFQFRLGFLRVALQPQRLCGGGVIHTDLEEVAESRVRGRSPGEQSIPLALEFLAVLVHTDLNELISPAAFPRPDVRSNLCPCMDLRCDLRKRPEKILL